MATRLTRNNAASNLAGAENRDTTGVGKKGSSLTNMDGRVKRKADEEVGQDQKNKKRAAFGDLTNATATAGTSIKNQVKKGLSNMVAKGKGSLMVRETKASQLRQTANKKRLDETDETSVSSSSTEDVSLSGEVLKSVTKVEKASVSSSSEEGLVCEFDSSHEETQDKEEKTGDVEELVAASYVINVPPGPTLPEGVIDFDAETGDDPQQHGEYAMQTFQYYKNRESAFRVPNYITAQLEITEAMRAILVDWLVEVQESFELNHETLYTAVKMTDLYLSKKQVRKEDLQLVGATACLISCKLDERIPPMVDDFLYVCDDAYSRDQLMRMERKMLQVVGFDLGYSLSYRFLRRYGRVCKVTMPVLTLARYILEFSLMEYALNVETSESLLAASCLVLAFKMKGIEGWVATLKYYSSYSPLDLEPTVQTLLAMLKRPHKENLKTVRSKYSHKVFHEVATIPLPEEVVLTNQG